MLRWREVVLCFVRSSLLASVELVPLLFTTLNEEQWQQAEHGRQWRNERKNRKILCFLFSFHPFQLRCIPRCAFCNWREEVAPKLCDEYTMVHTTAQGRHETYVR